jgi:phosphonate transport system ATP-binding protein
LVQESQIILADKPIASLDPHEAARVMAALRAINREDGITVICNLHAIDTARSFCDRIIGMARGQVVFDGLPTALTAVALRMIHGTDEENAEAFGSAEWRGQGAPINNEEERLPTVP